MKVHQAIDDALRQEGVKTVFAVMGDGNMRFLAELEARTGIDIVFARHETAAVAMADGYARATGRIGVCSVTTGPGIALTALPLLTAARRRSPVVLLAGDTAVGDSGRIQNMDQSRFIQGLGLESVDLRRPANAVNDLRGAISSALSRAEPVVVQIPMDVQDADVADSVDDGSKTASRARGARASFRPGPDELTCAADVIVAAKSPVIVAGRGALEDDAGAAVERLAALIDAPVFTTLPGRGLLADDSPWSAGVSGTFGSPANLKILHAADVAVVIGAGLGSHTTGRGTYFGKARLVRIDRRPSVGAWPGAVTACQMQGSARLTTEALIECIGPRLGADADRRSGPSARLTPVADGVAPPELVGDMLHPGSVMQQADRAIPDDASVIIGVGHFFAFAVEHLRVAGRRFIFTHDFGAIGQALPMALGVAKATGRRTFAIEGDGGSIMAIQELDTAARYGLPVTVLVINDEALGAEFHKLRSLGIDPGTSVMASPDLAAVAAGFGVPATTIRSPDELGTALAGIGGSDGPAFLDIRVSREIISDPYRRLHFPAG